MLSVAERLAQLPGVWELGWWMLMRPISLHHRLRALGIERPSASGWRLLWRGDAVGRAYVARMALLLLVGTSAIAVAIELVLAMVGSDTEWLHVAGGLVIGSAVGLAFDVAMGVAYGVAIGVGAFVPGSAALGVAMGVAWGVTEGMTGVVRGYVDIGAPIGAGIGIALGGSFSKVAGMTSAVPNLGGCAGGEADGGCAALIPTKPALL